MADWKLSDEPPNVPTTLETLTEQFNGDADMARFVLAIENGEIDGDLEVVDDEGPAAA